MKNRLLVLLACALVLSACGTAYRTIVRMVPQDKGEGFSFDTAKDSVTAIVEGVKVSARHLDWNALKEAENDFEHNPFISDEKALFTVFEIAVENNSSSLARIDVGKCVLLNGLGSQYNSLGDEYFKNIYPVVAMPVYRKNIQLPEYREGVIYTEDYFKRRSADTLMFKDKEIHPAVKQKGFLVFEQVGRESPGVTLVVTLNILGEDGKEVKRKDINFKFEQDVKLEKKQ